MQPLHFISHSPPIVSAIPLPQRKSHKGPQATHRATWADDFVFNQLDSPTSYIRTSPKRQTVARKPSLATVFEQRKLRCHRREIDDPMPYSGYRFSAIYCPPSYERRDVTATPFMAQQEHLENFAVLSRWHDRYLDITRTLKKPRLDDLRGYALGLYREEFRRGQLR